MVPRGLKRWYWRKDKEVYRASQVGILDERRTVVRRGESRESKVEVEVVVVKSPERTGR